ncbi:hypothetical protein [Oceanobacillus kapialis]|uniref:DUF4352 domain-containing protein n=1 Tax=Oceanobacillus kapialis TaxID=481353 RepID=A0ABW5Q3F5_9BACI
MKVYLIIILVLFSLMLASCTNSKLVVDIEESQVVFLEDYEALGISVIVNNESNFHKEFFQIKIEILDKELQHSLQTKGMFVGNNYETFNEEEVNGAIYEVEENKKIEGGATFNIHEDIPVDELKELITTENAIKVILYDEDGEELTNNIINNFKEI